MPTSEGLQHLEMSPDRALFDGAVDGMVCLFFRNERPLHGLSGALDWRFHGLISSCLRRGAIQGDVGECAYLPTLRNGRILHLILAGAGASESPGTRVRPPTETLEQIRKNLVALKIPKIGISRKDFGGANDSFLTQHLKGASAWVLQ